MTESSLVQSMGWTRRNVGVSVLLAMDEHRKQAGARLAALRDSKGLNQEELAHRAGVSVKTISRFENGRHDGRRGTVRALAEALGVDEADIIGPPPDPLGLSGESQLDRIESKLDQILTLLGAERLGPAEVLEQEAARLREQRGRTDAERKRKARSHKAA